MILINKMSNFIQKNLVAVVLKSLLQLCKEVLFPIICPIYVCLKIWLIRWLIHDLHKSSLIEWMIHDLNLRCSWALHCTCKSFSSRFSLKAVMPVFLFLSVYDQGKFHRDQCSLFQERPVHTQAVCYTLVHPWKLHSTTTVWSVGQWPALLEQLRVTERLISHP